MKKVKFIEIRSEISGWGGLKGEKCVFPKINETIEEMIKEGWEYCGFVPNEARGTGEIETISLVFQKEER